MSAPIGELIETLFDVLNSLGLLRGQGIPTDIRERLERLFNAPGEGADYAVCETTWRLRWLFYLDPEWVTERIIPLFDLEHPRSEPAWNGYLYTTELPEPELFALLKPHFLKVFPRSSSWAWDDGPIRRLNEFLVLACFRHLKDGHYISYAEARSALQQATEEGREHSIWFLMRIVYDLKKWRTFGKPFIQKAWPRELRFQTPTSSRNFAHLAEEADNNFPDVVKTVLPLLGPVDHVDMLIYGGTRDGNALASRFPEAMLALLDRVLPDGTPAPPACSPLDPGYNRCRQTNTAARRAMAAFGCLGRVAINPIERQQGPLTALVSRSGSQSASGHNQPSMSIAKIGCYGSRAGLVPPRRGTGQGYRAPDFSRCPRVTAASGSSAARISSSLGHHEGRSISVARSRMIFCGAWILYRRRALLPRNLAWCSTGNLYFCIVSIARRSSEASRNHPAGPAPHRLTNRSSKPRQGIAGCHPIAPLPNNRVRGGGRQGNRC
ncbi:MAG TPA: hypothetical protein VJ770_18965 [Stellaceae bacterium]|nr:hypothetical protein [Stellaceae bacterium]